MSASSTIGIIVVDYHSPQALTRFCESLIESDPQVPYMVLIQVVDASHLESLKAAELAELFANRSLIAGVTSFQGNVGFNVAINDGAAWMIDLPVVTDTLTLAFFNSDTEIWPGVIESCTKTLWSNDSYGVVGPRQINSAGKITSAGIFGTLTSPRHRGWQEAAGNKYTDTRDDCVTVSGSAYFTKAPIWEELAACPLYQKIDPGSRGAFLTCKHYYGETYYSYHLSAHGYKVVYEGDCTMIHQWHGASPVGSESWGEKNLRADRDFFRKACDIHGMPHD